MSPVSAVGTGVAIPLEKDPVVKDPNAIQGAEKVGGVKEPEKAEKPGKVESTGGGEEKKEKGFFASLLDKIKSVFGGASGSTEKIDFNSEFASLSAGTKALGGTVGGESFLDKAKGVVGDANANVTVGLEIASGIKDAHDVINDTLESGEFKPKIEEAGLEGSDALGLFSASKKLVESGISLIGNAVDTYKINQEKQNISTAAGLDQSVKDLATGILNESKSGIKTDAKSSGLDALGAAANISATIVKETVGGVTAATVGAAVSIATGTIDAYKAASAYLKASEKKDKAEKFLGLDSVDLADKQIGGLIEKIGKVQSNFSKAETDLGGSKGENKKAQEELAGALGAVSTAKSQLQVLKDSLNDPAKVKNVVGGVAAIEKAIKIAEKDIKALESTAAKAEVKADKTQAKEDKAQAKVDGLKATKDNLSASVATRQILVGEIGSAKQQLDKLDKKDPKNTEKIKELENSIKENTGLLTQAVRGTGDQNLINSVVSDKKELSDSKAELGKIDKKDPKNAEKIQTLETKISGLETKVKEGTDKLTKDVKSTGDVDKLAEGVAKKQSTGFAFLSFLKAAATVALGILAVVAVVAVAATGIGAIALAAAAGAVAVAGVGLAAYKGYKEYSGKKEVANLEKQKTELTDQKTSLNEIKNSPEFKTVKADLVTAKDELKQKKESLASGNITDRHLVKDIKNEIRDLEKNIAKLEEKSIKVDKIDEQIKKIDTHIQKIDDRLAEKSDSHAAKKLADITSIKSDGSNASEAFINQFNAQLAFGGKKKLNFLDQDDHDALTAALPSINIKDRLEKTYERLFADEGVKT